MSSEFTSTGEENYLRKIQREHRRKFQLFGTIVKSKNNPQLEKQIRPNTNSMMLVRT